MSIYHNHHIIPRHMGGSDEPSNLIKLTIEEHAEAHRKLWEEHGKEEDNIAWRMLSGQITSAEATKLAQKLPKSEEHKQKIKESNIITKNTPESKEKSRLISIQNHIDGKVGMKGKKHSPETIEKMKESAKKIASKRKKDPNTGKFIK